jgi:hypothetical protein
MKSTLITTIFLVIVVFIIGVIIGNTWNSSDETEISKLLEQSELDAESFLVEEQLFDTFKTNCPLTESRLSSQSSELANLGQLLSSTDAEKNLGPENYHYLKLKYHLMQLRTYILYKKLHDDCGKTTNVILYYFTRLDPQSHDQGIILDQLVAEQDLAVFAVEQGYSPSLSFLEQYYNISSSPSLVINYEHVMRGFTTKEDILRALNE